MNSFRIRVPYEFCLSTTFINYFMVSVPCSKSTNKLLLAFNIYMYN